MLDEAKRIIEISIIIPLIIKKRGVIFKKHHKKGHEGVLSQYNCVDDFMILGKTIRMLLVIPFTYEYAKRTSYHPKRRFSHQLSQPYMS